MSSSREIEVQIEQIEKNIEPISLQLDDKVKEFADALPQTVENWMNEETKRRIVENADIVNDAGIDSLRQLKSELLLLIGKLPEICANAISNKSEWPHRCSSATKTQSPRSSKEAYFPSVFRNAINPLGYLLNKYGLLRYPAGHSNTWEKVAGDQFRYAINLGFEHRRFPQLVKYLELRERHKSLSEDLVGKRNDLAVAKARELWENA